ncbi:hypothetical protein [Alteribacillus sp. HJP-4]|uniref:hypothetical protein n=1 Tax=Alteribacillus sp. HJP-4 TaxID=2775394 RepID=UPI0035CCC92B
MSQLQQINVELPEDIYSEIEHLTEEEKDSFFEKVLQEQIKKRKAADFLNEMKNGYLEMANINKELCKEFENVEAEAWKRNESMYYDNKYE